jgi:endonuclease YncB( thermonuclease family)
MRKNYALPFLFVLLLALFILLFLLLRELPLAVYGPFYVIDGDTVLKDGIKYRFKYIDAPELHRQKKWVMDIVSHNTSCLHDYALEAKDFVTSHLFKIEYVPWERGRYGRFLVVPYDRNGRSLEMELIEEGLAICYYRKPSLLDPLTTKCLDTEEKAKKERRGIWSCN